MPFPVIVQEQNQCKDYIQKSKEEVEQKENLASQDICNYIEGFDQLVESHNQLKTIVKEAHETYQQLKEQEDQESLDFTQTCIVQEKEQLRLQLMELNKQCAETQNKNKITEEEIVQLKKQLQDFTEDEKQTSRNLHQLDKVAVSAEQNLGMASQSDQWLHQIYTSASDCNRVDSVWKDGSHYYYTIYDETQDQPNLNLTLAISYINYDTQSTITKMKITGAQVDIQDLPIDDLVEEAVERNDLIMLVSDVKRRYCTRLTFLKELKDLRSRFPVDYISSKQLLRVIIGASSNMICNFLVPCTYPAVGRISMTTMEGHTNPEIFYQANDICGTLTDWIAFLEQQVTHQNIYVIIK
ncbi:uncharacterized protein TRIADDRAFT_54081 [Trichoplax adhaerens]|uniref:Uncharacterized protein n=1 Tax=Trichoplax adhaerens TaxID=10228 RepID=B3RR21_TRIAD|nr:hypothetical protein TRIADDRAFT_54081 [Trichoplax adhaerens]EDV26265.1 hypothetical protein TRIADDRAFT_54081 [Trichoplax adhaerens]|eukprot:XP_002110261.1 hypothetical protein TRIADDRAFT_54081 [Trichoplax adhaerens]